MAPCAPLGRTRAIQLVEQGSLPFSFGSPHPTMMALEQDGRFRIRALVIDNDEAMAASRAALAAGRGWMPEQHYALGKPTGKIVAEGASRAELVELMRTMDWPNNW